MFHIGIYVYLADHQPGLQRGEVNRYEGRWETSSGAGAPLARPPGPFARQKDFQMHTSWIGTDT